VSCAAVVLTFG